LLSCWLGKGGLLTCAQRINRGFFVRWCVCPAPPQTPQLATSGRGGGGGGGGQPHSAGERRPTVLSPLPRVSLRSGFLHFCDCFRSGRLHPPASPSSLGRWGFRRPSPLLALLGTTNANQPRMSVQRPPPPPPPAPIHNQCCSSCRGHCVFVSSLNAGLLLFFFFQKATRLVRQIYQSLCTSTSHTINDVQSPRLQTHMANTSSLRKFRPRVSTH
jgi:hypothetical protein